mmetsp:Transcript_19652/g.42114  ORF Transcript_19652/g.42114 Transcript_19652/m.42114 type:complete len:212 (-) Transcript_19652:332-967(-)|eukprot:CAMPEP_0172554820 /NCGR_PEP_ID=MMETSP1067-20121228/56597_1 /TAXON_ID=265564 ORGANISM="Thalassiosira punctigera, Strain Tpunct2005C2" /NCGR_SAMPLE_ID=MMETSP1067 /ASSEMBLY_ACC=CAM_ASM_000444 /LENGTH=211 /DNA_ID=CAMNT_0013343263 /DNA_START=74 /DNA_END=709 /DNA_ORIENTATION=-
MKASVLLRLALLVRHVCVLTLAKCRPFSITVLPERTAAFVPSWEKRYSYSNDAIRKVGSRLTAVDSLSSINVAESSIFLSSADDVITPPMEMSELQNNLQIEQLGPTTTIIVFIIGVIPFVWATYEFWRRIAVGASFGTGLDSVVIPSLLDESDDDNDLIAIGEDDNPSSSRGKRTLDRGALTVAYILFAVAGGSVAIALASVLMSPVQPM